jgi:molybdopterin molybdotransferase
MDGYAVRAGDTPGVLPVVGHSAAGRPASTTLDAGQAIGISTGAVVPEGADAVVPVERVTVRADEIEIEGAVSLADNIRSRGGDVRAGDEVLAAGNVLTAARIGAIAACGIETVVAHRAPRVTIVVTGSELRAPGEELEPGQIYESNGIMLARVFEEAGAVVERLAAAEDTEAALEQALARALEADVVVTSGGVSVGPHDLVRGVEAKLGVEEVFWGVAMRPGKPLAFGVRDATLVFGLPGNPLSSLVGALLFVTPALRALQGHPDPAPPFRPGALARAMTPRAERDDFARARISWSDSGPVLDPLAGQESHMIVKTTAADAIVHIPRGTDELPAGAPIGYLPL